MEKSAPLYKRLQKYFDIKVVKTTNPYAIPVRRVKAAPIEVIEAPVVVGYDWTSTPVGTVRLIPSAATQLQRGTVIAPAYDDTGIVGFGIIPAENASPQNHKCTCGKSNSGFMWHLFLIAVVCGLLTIIGLIIRLQYVHDI